MHVPFIRRNITITFTSPIVGGVPTDPKLIEGWLKANMPDVTEAERAKLAATTLSEVPKVIEEEAKSMWITFKRDETGIYLEGRQLKAAFKECANILRETFQKQEKEGKVNAKDKSRFTALRAKLAERLFVEDQKVYLHADTDVLVVKTKPDGTDEQPIHVMTAQGPRTALKRFDYCNPGTKIAFTVRWLDDGLIDDELLTALLSFMQWNGIGASRSQGNGLFNFTVSDARKA